MAGKGLWRDCHWPRHTVPFLILLWIPTVVDWYAAQKLVHSKRPAARRAWMLLSVVANLGMLAYFKYGTFALANFTALMASFGIAYPAFGIVLPAGISLHTLATMSYTLDIYLRRAVPFQIAFPDKSSIAFFSC